MKVLIFSYTALLCLAACKIIARQPVADLQAVTDGKLVLGVVASTSEAGNNAYRLLLCKREAAQDEQHFSNENFCRSALLDDSGNEVVLLANERRRAFGAKYVGYAAAAGGVALLAVGSRQGIKWLKVAKTNIDNTTASSAKVIARNNELESLNKNIAESKQQLDATLQKITERSKTLEAAEGRSTQLPKEIAELRRQIDSHVDSHDFSKPDQKNIKGVIERVTRIDADVGKELETLLYGSTGPLNADLLNTLSKHVDETDKIFKDYLLALKVSPQVSLGKDGVAFYRESYTGFKEGYEWVMEDLSKNIDDLMKRKPADFVDNLNLTVTHKYETASLYEAAVNLEHHESLQQMLLAMKNSDAEVLLATRNMAREQIADLQNADFPIPAELASKLGIDTKADFSTKFKQLSEAYRAEAFADDYMAVLQQGAARGEYDRHVAAEQIQHLYTRGLERFHELSLSQEIVRLSDKTEAGKFVRTLNSNSNDITKARETLLLREASRVETKLYVPQMEEFWQRLQRLGELEEAEKIMRQTYLAEIEGGVVELRRGLRAQEQALRKQGELLTELETKKNTLSHLTPDIKQGKKSLATHQHHLARLKQNIESLETQIRNAEQGRFDEINRITAEIEQNKALWKKRTITSAGVGAGLGVAAAVAINLDESIWGRGEKTLGKEYWQQIFADKKDFANPALVNDLSAIVHQLAELFGQRVNPSAFEL